MVFSSLVFLCVFLPVTYILHLVIPSIKAKNILLIAASLVFYAYGEPVYVLCMIVSAAVNYLGAYLIEKTERKKLFLTIDIVFNISMLVFFKYTGFIVEQINSLSGAAIPVPVITLPIGISFFTFQAMSYVIDVYRGEVKAQKNFGKVLLYISFFPQLIAGPIVKYHDIHKEIDNRQITAAESALGLRRFICGLAKKVIIANSMGQVADIIFASPGGDINILTSWLGAIAYMMQIYFDFSGYSDMAIGLGRMFGFHFQENFLYPYGSSSVKEFWRRWHISLSSWFKLYLYIPLGGNRKGKGRTCLNKIIVFFLTGLWHGANWTFIIWGLFHGAFLLLEDNGFFKKLPKLLTRIYTLLVVCVGFVIFRADNISQALYMIKNMFSGFTMTDSALSLALTQLTPWFIFTLAAALFLAAPVKPITEKIRLKLDNGGSAVVSGKLLVLQTVLFVLAAALLFWCMLRLSGDAYNPFIYFRF